MANVCTKVHRFTNKNTRHLCPINNIFSVCPKCLIDHIYIENNDISYVSGNGMAGMCLMRWSECQKCHRVQHVITGGSGGREEGGMIAVF